MDTLGNRLKRARQNINKTQKQISDILGISIGTLSGYERDYRDPDTETLNKLAEIYGVSTDYLLGRTENPKQLNSILPELTAKDKKDIAKQLERILEAMDSDTGLAFDGEPMDEETKELVKTAIKSNLELTKQLAKQKFTPKKYRKDKE